jgi:electron transfer flavoprotein alpha subunit
MKFLIFIKQVPNSAEIKFDNQTKRIIREGVKNEINPYDRRALTEAIRYRTENGGEVTAITMGPPQAREALQEALIMGVDSAIHITDERIAGSDTLATSRALAAAAKKMGFDLIFCGQHSTDSETGQVPVELAELLNIPCATAVRKIDYLPDSMIQATCETDEGWSLVEMRLPAVISTAERLIKPLKTKNADLSAAPENKIQTLNLEDLGLGTKDVGLSGSPTWVAEIQDVRVRRSPRIWSETDPEIIASKLLELTQAHQEKSTAAPPAENEEERQLEGEAWVWIERLGNEIRPVSFEILSEASSLSSVPCAVLAGHLDSQTAESLASYGARRIYHVNTDVVAHPDDIVAMFCERILEQKPAAVFFPATSGGKYLAPRVAARLGLGLTGDCVGLEVDENGNLAQLKPAFGGNIIAPIYSRTDPQMATIRPGALELRKRSGAESPQSIRWEIPENVVHQFNKIAKEIDRGVEATRMDHANIVIGIGVGLGQENVPLAHHLAELLGGSIGATRRVVDQGWLPRQFQIGLTGKFIAPKLYIGLGIGGRYNHMIGIQKASTIIAINQDPSAEVFQAVDVGIVGDCVAITRAFINKLERS